MRRRYYPSVDSLAPLPSWAGRWPKLAIKPTFLPDTTAAAWCYVSPAQRATSPSTDAASTAVKSARSSPAAAPPTWSRSIPSTPRWTRPGPGSSCSSPVYGDRDALVDLGPGARQGAAAAISLPSWCRSFPPLDAGPSEHHLQRPLRERRIRPLSGPPCLRAGSSRSPPTATRISTPRPTPMAGGSSSPPTAQRAVWRSRQPVSAGS